MKKYQHGFVLDPIVLGPDHLVKDVSEVRTVHSAHCTLHTAHCTLSVNCLLFTVNYTLYSAGEKEAWVYWNSHHRER